VTFETQNAAQVSDFVCSNYRRSPLPLPSMRSPFSRAQL